MPRCWRGRGPASPMIISPTNPHLRGKTRVIARATTTQPTVVRALVTSRWHDTGPDQIKTLVDSRIVVVRRVFETIQIARGAPPPISPHSVLRPTNVIATSPIVRTTDLNDHQLVARVPPGLRSRDYFVVDVQTLTELCRPRGTAQTAGVIGLVRITSS